MRLVSTDSGDHSARPGRRGLGEGTGGARGAVVGVGDELRAYEAAECLVRLEEAARDPACGVVAHGVLGHSECAVHGRDYLFA